MKKRIILLGSSGYIGSSLFYYLSKFKDIEIHTVDTEYFKNYNNNVNHTKLYYSYLTKSFLSDFSVIILCAAHSSVKMVQNDPDGALFNNVINFYQLFDKIKSDQLFIYMSSSSVYAGMSGEYLDENSLCYKPLNLYDLQKHTNDMYAELSKDKIYFGLRLGTVAGGVPNCNLRVDTCVNSFFSSYKQNGSINVFDGHIKRPFVGINDVCRAVKTILDNGNKENKGLYNLCSFNISINQLGDKVSSLLKCPINKIKSNNNHLYDFTINNFKFINSFDFKFEDDVQSIIQSLDENWHNMHKGVRDKLER